MTDSTNRAETVIKTDNQHPAPRRGVLHDLFIRIERLWDRLRHRDASPEPVLDLYTGYARPDGCLVRGRVLNTHRFSAQIEGASRRNALRNMARNFFTDEMPDVRVSAAGVETFSDEEGYFHLLIERLPPGSHQVDVALPDFGLHFDAAVLVPSADAKVGIISDIDDTVMQTGAYWLPRNLWTSATTYITERLVFDDTVTLLTSLQEGTNPVFYVSSSPWNLHTYLSTVFKTRGVPEGPMFLRDLGISETQFIKSSHGSHKGDAIDEILAANPGLEFVLIGDSGQHDAIVYHDAIDRHPGRIRQVVLRDAGKVDQADRDAAEAIRLKGVTLFTGASLASLSTRAPQA